MRAAVPLVIACMLVSCTTSAPSVASPTSTSRESVAPTVASSAATRTQAPAGTPPLTRGSTLLVPTLVPRNDFAALSITINTPPGLGQPAEGIVWTVDPYVADSAYVARAMSVFGASGPGYLSRTPGGFGIGSAPAWRLWSGDGVLAVNETSGEVIFLAGTRDDGPFTPGAAQHDPAPALEALVRSLGSTADFAGSPSRFSLFRGAEVSAAIAPLAGGPWSMGGSHVAVVLFPRYGVSAEQEISTYDTDEMGVLTSKERIAALVHRPLGRVRSGDIYPITTFGDAMKELKAAPARYLRFLSSAPGKAMSFTIDPNRVVQGYAWASAAAGDIRRAGRTLVPVWVVPASGTTAEGASVDALFTLDAVVPQMRAASSSRALSISADDLLREQFASLDG